MSLLSETASTVIAGKYLKVDQAFNTQFRDTKNLKGYSVITGALVPRELGNYLALDNVTGEPIRLPPNVMPYKAFYVPTVPLEGPNLNFSILQLRLWDDVNFSNAFNNWGSLGTFSGIELNTKCSTEMSDVAGYVSDFTGYTYPGMILGFNPLTAGQLQLYIYYIPCQTPTLP